MKANKTYEVYARERDRKGVSDYRVARDTGVAASTICEWGKGMYTPKTEKLILIAQYLGIPVTAFFE